MPILFTKIVFLEKELWNKIKEIPTKYKLAGDYWLWINFAKYEKLWTIKTDLSFLDIEKIN